jgi:hypothetical protein
MSSWARQPTWAMCAARQCSWQLMLPDALGCGTPGTQPMMAAPATFSLGRVLRVFAEWHVGLIARLCRQHATLATAGTQQPWPPLHRKTLAAAALRLSTTTT